MDVALEIVDYYVADAIYAKLLPITRGAIPSNSVYDAIENSTRQYGSTWEYTPTTHLFYLEPTEAAYESMWSRDNIYRQLITLMFIGW